MRQRRQSGRFDPRGELMPYRPEASALVHQRMLRPRDFESIAPIEATFDEGIPPSRSMARSYNRELVLPRSRSTEMVRYKPAALAIVRDDKHHVLAVRRPTPPHELVVPGGEVERGETPEQAALRELREETNILGRRAQLVWASASPTDGRQVYVFVVIRWSGAAAPLEGDEVAWMDEGELVDQAGRYASFHRKMFRAAATATRARRR